MAAGSKAGLYQNAQSASYLPLTLVCLVILNFVPKIYITTTTYCLMQP